MPDLERTVFALLDRAAEDATADVRVDAIVRLGRRRRRLRHGLQAGAAAVAVGAVITGVTLATAPGDRVVPTQPTPTATSTTTPLPSPSAARTATAAQLAGGRWTNVPRAPFALCGGATATRMGAVVLVVQPRPQPQTGPFAACDRAAETYDPGADRWQPLPAPPLDVADQPLQAVWTGAAVDVVNDAGSASEWDPQHERWTALPTVPARVADPTTFGQGVVLYDGARTLVVGAGARHEQVFALAGDRWTALASLPPGGSGQVASIAATAFEGHVYAAVSLVDRSLDSVTATSRLLRLDGDQWTALTRPDGFPSVVTALEPAGDRLLVVGTNCPPGLPCPLAPPLVLLTRPGESGATDLGRSPLGSGAGDPVVAGDVVVEVNLGTYGPDVHPGGTVVYDTAAGRWLTGPRAQLSGSYSDVWTDAGLVVIGPSREKCVSCPSGQVLRPGRG